jgi:hypothetical protein
VFIRLEDGKEQMEKRSFGKMWLEKAKNIRSSYALISFLGSVIFFVVIVFVPAANGLKIIPYAVGGISTLFLLYALVYAIPKGIWLSLHREIEEASECNKKLGDVSLVEKNKNLLSLYPREKMVELEKKVNYQLRRLTPDNMREFPCDFWNAPKFPEHILSKPVTNNPIKGAVVDFLDEIEHICTLIETGVIDEDVTRKIYGKYTQQSFKAYNLFFKDLKNSKGELISKYAFKWLDIKNINI